MSAHWIAKACPKSEREVERLKIINFDATVTHRVFSNLSWMDDQMIKSFVAI